MTIDSFTTLFFTMAFVIPGYILNSVYRRITPQAREESQISLLRFIYFSLINYGVWSWLIYWIYNTSYYKDQQLLVGIIWMAIIFVSPLVLGIIWGLINQKKWIEGILIRIGINSINSIPTSWDYKFSSTKNPLWVLVTLKDNSLVAGYWGTESFASSDGEERDLYIEKVYVRNGNKPWKITSKNNNGIFISGDEIKTIEFFTN